MTHHCSFPPSFFFFLNSVCDPGRAAGISDRRRSRNNLKGGTVGCKAACSCREAEAAFIIHPKDTEVKTLFPFLIFFFFRTNHIQVSPSVWLVFLFCDILSAMNHNMSLRGLNVMSLQVSSVEVVQAYIDRIQEVNPFVNAVVKDRQETIISISLMSDSVLLSCSYWLFCWQEDRNIFLAQHRVWWCEAFFFFNSEMKLKMKMYQYISLEECHQTIGIKTWCLTLAVPDVCLFCHITFAVGKCAKVVWGKYKKDLSAEVFSANENM